jgi:hypothetical protein
MNGMIMFATELTEHTEKLSWLLLLVDEWACDMLADHFYTSVSSVTSVANNFLIVRLIDYV